MRAALVWLCVCVCFARADLFDGVWRTYNLALNGAAPALPLNVPDAVAAGWVPGSPYCVTGLGFEYFYEQPEPTKRTPLSLWFTNGGSNISGISIYVFGENSAPAPLVSSGYWRQAVKLNRTDVYFLSVGFRYGPVCDPNQAPPALVGDYVIVNPDTALSLFLPLNESDAYCGGWVQGSAMKCFGTHYFYHTDPDDLWNISKVNPVGVMYWKGQLTTFMIITPEPQRGGIPPGDGYWDQPPLPPSLMCQNWCDDSCAWHNTWSTIHIFLTSDWATIVPEPNEGPPVYRSCENLGYSC